MSMNHKRDIDPGLQLPRRSAQARRNGWCADDRSLGRKGVSMSDPHKTALNFALKAGWLRRSCQSLRREYDFDREQVMVRQASWKAR